MTCNDKNCSNGPLTTGHALYRISPKGKGQKFIGLCANHYPGKRDPVTEALDRRTLS